MHAPSQTALKQSHISLTFGQKITSQTSPININLTVDHFSQKNQNIRFNIQQMLKTQIADGTLVIELMAKKGLGAELADKIMSHLKKNDQYNQMIKKKELKMKAIGKGDTCYLFFNFSQVKQFFEQKLNAYEQLKKQNTQPNLDHTIKLQIKSRNNCQQLTKLIQAQGLMRAFYDSLSLDFTFQKTKLVETTISKFLQLLQVPNVTGVLKSFKKLDLALNFASTSELDKYESLRVFVQSKVINKAKTSFFTPIKGQFNDEIKLFYFHPILSMSSKIHAEHVDLLIDALFEDSN